MNRTDPHRPGAIVPANYVYVFSYSLPTFMNGMPVPAINVDLIVGLRKDPNAAFAKTGGIGKCSVCGAHFVYGDLWRHVPSGEYIHLGHDCADKYSLLADRSEWELANGREREAVATALLKKQKAEQRTEFLKLHPGLQEALETKHRIVEDIKDRFVQYCNLSPKQIDLVFKLANEVKNPKPAEVKVPAPEGRVTFRGTVVALKEQDGQWGKQLKMCVKVTTPEGIWLAWGTAPTIRDGKPRIHSTDGILCISKGNELEITATLSRGREPHFAFMSRPKAKFIEEVRS